MRLCSCESFVMQLHPQQKLEGNEDEITSASGLTRRESFNADHPNMSELRIVLLGKDALANHGVRNNFLGICKSKEPPADEEHRTERVRGQLEDRDFIVINDPHLLQPDLNHLQIAKRVKDCVYLSDPGPHAIILVLQHNDFSEENIRRVKYVLKQFSDKAIKRSIVLTTDKQTQASVIKNSAMHQIIQACGGGHIQFEQRQPSCYSEIIQRVEKIKDEHEEFLKCELFDDAEEGISESEVRVEEGEEENTKGSNGGIPQFSGKGKHNPERIHPNTSASGKAKLNLVLCGRNTKLKASVSDMLQGKTSSTHSRESSLVCVKTEVTVHESLITVVELPALTELSEEEVTCQTLQCVSLCDSGVHLFLLIIPVGPLTDEDKIELEKIQKIFYYKEHFMVLFTTHLVDQSVRNSVTTAESQRVVSLYGSHYNVVGLTDHRNFKQIFDLLEYIKSIKTEPYSLQMYIKAQEKRVRHELEEKLSEMEIKIKELQQKVQQKGEDAPSDSDFLRIVLIGKTGNGKSETGNTILGKEEFHTEASPDSVTTVCMKGVGEVQGRSAAVVDTPGLFDTTLSNEKVQEEIVKCVSLSAPGPHVFIIVLSVGRFTNEEKNTVDLIKMIFGPSAAQFSIVLFTRGDDLKNETIGQYVEKSKNADLKKLIRDCGNRFLVFNNRDKQDKAQVTWLFKMIEEMKKSNKGQYFSNRMFEEAEMSIKKRVEEILKEKESEIQTKYEMEMETMIERLDKEKRKADEVKIKMMNQFREKEKALRKESEEKEKAEQKRREEEDNRRSDEDKQQKAAYQQKIGEMQNEIENQRLLYEKQQKEKEEQDKKREEKYKQDQEKLKDEQKRVMAELKKKQEEENKRRHSEEQRRICEEEEERQRWKRRIKEHEHDKKEIQENLKQQQREWEEETKKQIREREEEERKRKERHEDQLREKQEELEKMRKKSEREREEERQKIEEERQQWRDSERRVRDQKERELEEKKNELQKHYEQLAQERKEDWERSKREDDERREAERKRWRKMIKDLKHEQEVQISRREKEEKDRKEKEEKGRNQMKKEYEQNIKDIKKEHEDEARKQAEEFNEFRQNKDRLIQELTEKLKYIRKDYEDLEKVFESLLKLKSEETKELRKEIERLKIRRKCFVQ